MAVPALRSSSGLVSATPGVLTLSIPVPSHVDGDLIFVWTWGYRNDADLVNLPEMPPEATEIASVITATEFHQVFIMPAESAVTSTIDLTMQQSVNGWTGYADIFYNIDWVNGPIDHIQADFAGITPDPSTPMPVIVPVLVAGPNRLVYVAWRGLNTSGVHSDDVSGPSDWTAPSDRATFTSSGAEKVVTRTIAADEDVIEIAATSAGGYTYYFVGVTFVGSETAAIPPPDPSVAPALQIQPDLLRLGCAESYTAYLTDNTYENIIDVVRWSGLTWDRVEDDISSATATLPDELGGVQCVAKHGGLVPWQYGLYIERDDQLVWRGPVVNVARSGSAITVSAADPLVRYRKRFLLRDIVPPANYTNVDAGRLFYDILTTHAAQPSDAWSLPCPLVSVASSVTRTLRPREFKMAWDMLQDLLDTSVDAYVMNGVLYLWEPGHGWRYQARVKRTLEGPYNANHDLVYGTFTEDAWSRRPEWSIDGMSQGNFIAVPGTESGEHAFRSYESAENVRSQSEYGVLDYVEPDTTEPPEDKTPAEVSAVLRSRAITLLALRAYAPAVIEGGVLSENAPVSIDHLRPGSIWRLDTYDVGYGQLLQVGRVKRIAVTVSASDSGEIKEEITPTLYPPGWQGEVDA